MAVTAYLEIIPWTTEEDLLFLYLLLGRHSLLAVFSATKPVPLVDEGLQTSSHAQQPKIVIPLPWFAGCPRWGNE